MFYSEGYTALTWDMEKAETWELVKKSEFKVEDANEYFYMTFTSNHTRAAIQEAVKEKESLGPSYENIMCLVVFCEDFTQAAVVGADDNETADLHLSTSWFDRVQKFRRILQQDKHDTITDRMKRDVLKSCGLPHHEAALKTHRDMFTIATLSDAVWKSLEKLQTWYQGLDDPSVITQKRYFTISFMIRSSRKT